jgi:hypothetical protein
MKKKPKTTLSVIFKKKKYAPVIYKVCTTSKMNYFPFILFHEVP